MSLESLKNRVSEELDERISEGRGLLADPKGKVADQLSQLEGGTGTGRSLRQLRSMDREELSSYGSSLRSSLGRNLGATRDNLRRQLGSAGDQLGSQLQSRLTHEIDSARSLTDISCARKLTERYVRLTSRRSRFLGELTQILAGSAGADALVSLLLRRYGVRRLEELPAHRLSEIRRTVYRESSRFIPDNPLPECDRY